MEEALFINGVFETVLEEIMHAQETSNINVFYLQPHSSNKIKRLENEVLKENNRISLYISTTKKLDMVCYTADIVRWENKQQISEKRLKALNAHIQKYQPSETDIYLKSPKGNNCVNLIHVINLIRITNPFSVANLIKVSDGTPLKSRKQSGGYSYVFKLPINIEDAVAKEYLDDDLEKGIKKSLKSNDSARKERLSAAPAKPQQVQVISHGFRRNPDVIVEVLKRANGKCERCSSDAPFLRAKDNSPYLEIHHWIPLAEGGDDTIDNAGALCPNCHMELHFGHKNHTGS